MTDALGTVRRTVSDAGAIQGTAAYSAWGVPLSGFIAPFGFTGELQSGAGLTYLRARWYNAASGRFGSRDPFPGFSEQPYSLHSYQYGYANPVLYTDPSGELAIFVMGGWNGVYQDIEPNNGVVKLANVYGPRIPGSDCLVSADSSIPAPFTPDTHDKIASTIAETYHDTCGQEPIVILGYSRGGSTVQRAVEILNNEHPEVRVDLVITFGMVHASNFTIANLNRKMPNVIKHLNFMSEQANAAMPPGGNYPAKIFGHPEQSIQGSEEYTVNGTDHFTVIDEIIHPYYDKSKEDNPPLGPPPPPIRNMAWDILDRAIDVLVKTQGPRPYNQGHRI